MVDFSIGRIYCLADIIYDNQPAGNKSGISKSCEKFENGMNNISSLRAAGKAFGDARPAGWDFELRIAKWETLRNSKFKIRNSK